MSNLQETPVWVDGIYQLTEETPVLGKQEDVPGDGPANIQAQQLANRTQYLKAMTESIADGKEHTFYKTVSDPDGTIAGIQGTDSGKVFRVAQGEAEVIAFNYYLNDSGSAKLIAVLIGQGSVTNNIRFFESDLLAEKDLSAGNILSGSKVFILNSEETSLADEYVNNDGVLVATGGKIPLQKAVEDARRYADSINNRALSQISATNAVSAVQIDNDTNTVKHIFSILQQSISAAVTSALCPQRSAFIISSMSNGNTNGQPGGLTVKVAGTATYQNSILPGESVVAGVKTTPYSWRDLSGVVPSGIIFDASVVRVIYTFTLTNQSLATTSYNVQDKTGRFAATTQNSASASTVQSVSSHSGGGIQLAIPKSVLSGAGFALTNEGVKAWLETLGVLAFYCLATVAQTTENFIDFAVMESGQFSLDVSDGVVFSGGLYSSRIPPVEGVVDDLSRISAFSGFTRQVFAGDLMDASGLTLTDSAALFLTDASTNGIMTNINGVTILKDATELARRYLPGASTLTGGVMSSLYKPFRMRDLSVQTLLSASAGMVRILYSLPAGFGALVYDYAVPVCVDISGLFYPTPANGASTITQRATGGHTTNNMVQFVLTLAELTSAGYDPTDKYAVDRYLRSLAVGCQFVAYTGTNRTFTLDSSLLAMALPAGVYAFSYLTSCGLKGVIRKPPQAVPVDTGAHIRQVADVRNGTAKAFAQYPIELRASLPAGQVQSSDCLVLTDSDGTEIPCQWADEFHCNNRRQSNEGYHADGSLKDGSVFLMDSLAAGAIKYYELKAFNRPVRSYIAPGLVRSGRDYLVTVDGWTYKFTGPGQYQLASVTDPSGTVHNIATLLYLTGLVSGASSEVLFDYKPTLRLVNTGPVFTEVETVLFNSAFASIPAGVLRGRIRTRMFKNGKVQIYTQVTAVSDIAAGLLYGVSTRCNLNDGAYAFDNLVLTTAWADPTSNQNWSVTLVRANGDVHRDGTGYGPLRPVRATFLNPSPTSVRGYAGWVYDASTDAQYSFANWPVKAGWTWTSEYWIDANNSLPDTDKTAIASQVHNRPSGFLGHCPFPSVARQSILDTAANHVFGSMQWWHSPDATLYGGGTYGTDRTLETAMYRSYAADIMNLLAFGKGSFDTVYSNFNAYLAKNWNPLATIGTAYTSGRLVLQFASRLVIPAMQWLYFLAVKNGDAAKVTELQAGIKSLADALVTKFNALGGNGIPLNGSASDTGNSNSNATAMRAIALGIYAGQDATGSYLTAYNALEVILTRRTGYMRIEGIITDGNAGQYGTLGASMYLHYQAYAANNYLFAAKLLNRTPVFDLVNFIMLATGGMGGFRDIDYCVSESRRGSANTITFALFPLLLAESASASNAAEALLSQFRSEYGPRPGFPVRFFGFDGATSAGNVVSDISFVATTLADAWLFYHLAFS